MHEIARLLHALIRHRADGAEVLERPPRHEYDALRALEHFRAVGAMPDERMQEAIDLVHAKRLPEGTWPLDLVHGGDAVNDYGPVGEPNRWITLKALRVLRWAEG